VKALAKAFILFKAGAGGPAAIVAMAASLAAAGGLIAIADEAFSSLEREISKTAKELTRVGTDIGALTELIDDATKVTDGLSNGLADIGDEANSMASGVDAASAALDRLEQSAQRIFSQTRNPFEVWQKGFWEATDALNAGLISMESYRRRLGQLEEAWKGAFSLVPIPRLEALEESVRMRRLAMSNAPRPAPAQRIGFGRELDVSRESIAGLSLASRKEQRVSDTAALAVLKNIDTNTKTPAVARVS